MEIMSADNIKNKLNQSEKTVFITGVTGQDGSLMADYLLNTTTYNIVGGARRLAVHNHLNIGHLEDNPRFNLVNFDLTDTHSIDKLIISLQPDYFINLAAQTFVKSSWDFPVQTWECNTTGVLHILEAIRQHQSKCRFYNAGCHSTDTRVLTPNGLKYYTEMKIGDLVYSINQTTNELELKKIKKVFEYDFKGELMEFKNGGLRVTPNHTMLYKTSRNKILSKQAKDFIHMSDVKYPINLPYKGKMLEKMIDLTEFIPIQKRKGNKNYGKHITSINAYDLMYLIGLYIGDGSCRIMKKKRKVKCLFENRERNSFGQFSSHSENYDEFEVEYQCPQCVLDIPANDECFPKVISTLERNNIKWKLHGTCDITFHQWGINPYFSECGHLASTKKIPSWIFELDSSYQLKVLEGIRDSDGDKRNNISTVSEQLQQDLLKLHINCGIIPTFRQRPPRSVTLKDGRVINGNYPERNVYALKENTGYQRGKWKAIPYEGKVWCFEIEDNHNFLVERHGKLTFSGNSSEEFGDVLYTPQDENHPMRPRSPYGASKAAARQLVKVYRESYNLYAIQSWLFNHEGIRRGKEFVTRKISSKVAEIYKAIINNNEITSLELGNLDAMRDWSDAEDCVKAIWLMLNQEEHNKNFTTYRPFPSTELKEYVVSSGESHCIREFIEIAFRTLGIEGTWVGEGLNETFQYLTGPVPKETIKTTLVKINPAFYRPAEVEQLCGDSSKIRTELNWTPKTSFKQLVEKMVKNDLHPWSQKAPSALAKGMNDDYLRKQKIK